MDYFTQFCFLRRRFMGQENFWYFRERYFFRAGPMGYEWFPRPGTLTAVKQEVHALAHVRTRKQCLIGPKKVYERRHVEMNPEQKRVYKKLQKEYAMETASGEDQLTNWATVRMCWEMRLAGGFRPITRQIEGVQPVYEAISEEKTKELYGLLMGELKDQKVVVWFRHTAELEHVWKFLAAKGIVPVTVYGKKSLEERNKASSIFRLQSTADCQVMLAQTMCGRFGLDWSVADTAIYYSNSFVCEDRAQSEDRIIHPKKQGSVLYIDLVTRGTVDVDISAALREKWANTRVMMSKLVSEWNTKRRAS
jgi:SNF2 family DNA or RNA helicase